MRNLPVHERIRHIHARDRSVGQTLMTPEERAHALRVEADKLLDRIVDWARKNNDVRAAILVGSHAGKHLTDEFSDYDVAMYVADQDQYAHDHSWLGEIGEVWLCLKDTGRGEADLFPVHYRLTIFAPGTRVDFSIYSVGMLNKVVTQSPPPGPNLYTLGYRVLVDKDEKTKGMAPPFSRPFVHEKPSEDSYRQVVEDFWHEAHTTAKYLARGDLWSAKFRDWNTKKLLLAMIEWHAHAKHGWKHDTAHAGKRMRSWVDSEVWQALHSVFAHFDAEDSWNALFSTIELFREMAGETAEMLGYQYLEHEDKHMGDLIMQMGRSARPTDPPDCQ